MADWTNITDASLDPDAPLTSELAYAWRDNPIAIAQGSPNAPYNQYAWHPYNGVTVGDGLDGLIYDFAVTGAVAAIDAPLPLTTGYDYRMRVRSFSTTSNAVLSALFRRTSTGVFTAVAAFNQFYTMVNTETVDFELELYSPWATGQRHYWRAFETLVLTGLTNGGDSNVTDPLRAVWHVAPETLDGFRLSLSIGTTDAGKIFLDKRRSVV